MSAEEDRQEGGKKITSLSSASCLVVAGVEELFAVARDRQHQGVRLGRASMP